MKEDDDEEEHLDHLTVQLLPSIPHIGHWGPVGGGGRVVVHIWTTSAPAGSDGRLGKGHRGDRLVVLVGGRGRWGGWFMGRTPVHRQHVVAVVVMMRVVVMVMMMKMMISWF